MRAEDLFFNLFNQNLVKILIQDLFFFFVKWQLIWAEFCRFAIILRAKLLLNIPLLTRWKNFLVIDRRKHNFTQLLNATWFCMKRKNILVHSFNNDKKTKLIYYIPHNMCVHSNVLVSLEMYLTTKYWQN